MCRVLGARAKAPPQSSKTDANRLSADAFVSINFFAVVPFLVTSLDKKIRMFEISATYEISCPGLASQ